MVTKSPEETQKKYVGALGEEFGDVYYHALNEWCDLWLTWKQFENLFGHGPERVELMNRCGAGFFYNVDRYFFEAVALAVCRLSDPVRSARRSNLTVMLFQQFMDTEVRKKRMADLLEIVSKTTDFARDWRNRHISHNDKALKFGTASPLKEATRNHMNKAIAALHEVLSYISADFMESDLPNEVIDNFNNEMAMLNRLYLGDEVHQRELEELRTGRGAIRRLPHWLGNK